eukprot:1162069-Pelagomonas_calceolata.AAC.6
MAASFWGKHSICKEKAAFQSHEHQFITLECRLEGPPKSSNLPGFARSYGEQLLLSSCALG